MKKRPLITLLCLLLALAPAISRADGDKPKKEDTELEKSMDVMAKSWRKLRKQAADPAQNADSLTLLGTIMTAADKNLTLTPDLARDVPAEKRDAFVAGYKEKMKELVAAFGELQTALKANDNKAAAALVDKIGGLQKAGHKEYKRPD